MFCFGKEFSKKKKENARENIAPQNKTSIFDFNKFEKVNNQYDEISDLEIVHDLSYKNISDDKSLYILLRHSERADQIKGEDERIINQEDPGISKNGESIAFETGVMVEKLIRKVKERNLCGKDAIPVIVSSPYLRCMQTSVHLIKGLKKSGVDVYKNSIFMEEGWMERQDDKKYKGADKWVTLVIEKMTQEQRDLFLGGVKLVKNKIMYYNKWDNLNRVAYDKSGHRWADQYQNMPEIAFQNKERFIFVVVSHGCSLETFAHFNYNQRCNAYYCSTNQIDNTFQIDQGLKKGQEYKFWKNKFLDDKTNYYASEYSNL